jgi:hypothetical protein
MLEDKEIKTQIYDEMVELDSYDSIEDLNNIADKSLVALMYPVKKQLMEKIESVISKTESILYTPW